ncbi:hypothetical protein LUX29_12390 [Aureimonas altamirensis]|uniref:hypothetical protein n=1 Tax=Aureimonas altamirensis TaxID=370622 RepID=UPI001E2E13C9|nr:hypothetical protein [Aureimonas altamirensis]UHD43889.1 hypothetical protein LUX29_12390 [Aureimonas altamirensis]
MSQKEHKQQPKADRHSFYTYVYGRDPMRSSRRFYATQDEAREDVVACREALLRESGRNEPLEDMAIVRFDTVPITSASLADLFNDLDGQLGGFIERREIVAVITEPQAGTRQIA